MLEVIDRIKTKTTMFRVKDAYYNYMNWSNFDCGTELCRMPIVEVADFSGGDRDFVKKPKILITAGVDGNDVVSMSNAMNLITFIGNIDVG